MPSTLLKPIAPTAQDSLLAAKAASCLSDGHLDISQLPEVALQLLSRILDELGNGRAVSIVPVSTDMTTNQAADYLNVSRPYLIKLLDEGKIPFHLIGRHRRIDFQELNRYKQQRKERSYALLGELQAEAQELNMGY